MRVNSAKPLQRVNQTKGRERNKAEIKGREKLVHVSKRFSAENVVDIIQL